MKQRDAKAMVLARFREWAAANGKSIPYTAPEGGHVFYNWLRKNHAEALEFRATGNPWQTVHGWLLQSKMVTH